MSAPLAAGRHDVGPRPANARCASAPAPGLSTPLLPLRRARSAVLTQELVAGGTSPADAAAQEAEFVAQGRGCTVVAAGAAMASPLLRDFAAAIFAVGLGATDGLSLGSIAFPHSAEHPNTEYRSLGMSMGLLSMVVSNVAGCFTSQFPHAVGGAVLPVVPIMASYFNRLGPEQCATVMFAMPLMTTICGLLTIAIGHIGVLDIVKSCPFVVFGGFIAGTGAQLLEYALNLLCSDFVRFTDAASWRAMLTWRFWRLVGPSAVLASVVFLLPRHVTARDTSFLLPQALITMAAVFYLVLFVSHTTIESARSQEYLFDHEVPTSLNFYRIWTMQDFASVRYDQLCSQEFCITTLQVFLMSLLTTTQNICGTAEATSFHVDINTEIRSAGVQSVCCGMLGSMPGNIVMSFSVTAHKMGARSKRFSAMLASSSIAFFVFGDFVIAFLPRMVPGCMLFWLGLVLVVYWLWDGVGHVSAAEHAVVFVMIATDLIMGPGVMMLLGLALTLVITLKRLMAIRPITSEYTVRDVRSDVLRTGVSSDILKTCGDQAVVLHFARGYFSFINAAHMIHRVQELAAERGMAMLVLNFQGVLGVDSTALKALQELLAIAAHWKFHVCLCSAEPAVTQAVVRFGLPCASRTPGLAGELAEAPASGGTLILVDACDEDGRHVPALTLALELAEEFVIARNPLVHRSSDRACCTCVRNISFRDAWTYVTGSGVRADLPALPLLVDIHCWLHGYYSEYGGKAASILPSLAELFVVEEYGRGDAIYAFDPAVWPRWRVGDAGSAAESPAPPLVWLLGGEVEHVWYGPEHEEAEHSEEDRKA
ncbi:unnamed protein product [Prorocentrum cordatum]|uniref:STAS domain-containing protein n=1 Tax=Prorocentrum cordatum TaxID=2364126 RepID=A0ABN9PS58_9DINO|nr:unnamed protein product [Polarella glacialis]